MQFEKRALYKFNMPYALGTFVRNGQTCVVAATEDEGEIVVVPPPYTRAEVLVAGPGGCMSLVSHPEFPGELYAIMGCFLGYNFHGGALYRIATLGASVVSTKVAELPFAHRMEIVEKAGQLYLLLANLASTKDSPADWSRAGALYAAALTNPADQKWILTPVLENLHKNHGFLKCQFLGRPTVLVSGTEGVFELDLSAPGAGWNFVRLLAHEVSEVAVFDLDGDGREELITIEPFHGNVLAVYKASDSGWNKVWEAQLNFGHCVLAGTVAGKPSVLVSNRAGDKDLLLFQFAKTGPAALRPSRFVVESGVGAANMLFMVHEGQELILATNQTQGELVRYELKL